MNKQTAGCGECHIADYQLSVNKHPPVISEKSDNYRTAAEVRRWMFVSLVHALFMLSERLKYSERRLLKVSMLVPSSRVI